MLEKLTDWTLTLSLVAAMTLLGNFIGYEVMPLTALPGIISLMVIVLVGMVIHECCRSNCRLSLILEYWLSSLQYPAFPAQRKLLNGRQK